MLVCCTKVITNTRKILHAAETAALRVLLETISFWFRILNFYNNNDNYYYYWSILERMRQGQAFFLRHVT